MSINVYLQGDEVMKLEGFKTQMRRNRNQEWNEYTLPGIKLFREKGRWYIILHEPTELIPAAVEQIVEEISFHEWIPLRPKREAGIYRHESAEAVVELDKIFGENMIKIRIKAKNMKDLNELFTMIKIGSIRPEESYEGEQTGMSRVELEATLEQMKKQIKTRAEDNARLRAALRTFCQKLTEDLWPICTKKKMRLTISTILNTHRT